MYVNEEITVVIIDDEPGGRTTLRQLLLELAKPYRLIGEASSVRTGVELISDVGPDVLLLDIHLGDGSGFDLLERIDARPNVIFVTAYDQYAIKALRLSAVDYLLKPVDPQEFSEAMERMILTHRRTRHRETARVDQMSELIHMIKNHVTSPRRIAVPDHEGYRFLNIDEIVYCSAESNYTRLHHVSGVDQVVSRTLGEYEELFASSEFIRIHQSYLVNIRFIDRYVRGKGGYVVLLDGTMLDVAARRKAILKKLLLGSE